MQRPQHRFTDYHDDLTLARRLGAGVLVSIVFCAAVASIVWWLLA
jgi:hypothetical protein